MKTPLNCSSTIKRVLFSTALATATTSLMLVGCAKSASPAKVPASWHELPEDSTPGSHNDDSVNESIQQAETGLAYDEFLNQNGAALSQVENPAPPVDLNASTLASGKLPWHLEYFITDLAVSAQGVLAGLLMKGTPGITLIWRHQNPSLMNTVNEQLNPAKLLESTSNLTSNAANEAGTAADFMITDATKQAELSRQLEPAIRAAVSSGRVTNEWALRQNLTKFANDFRVATRGLNDNPGLSWWVQRYRVEVNIDGSGRVTPLITVGGNLRFRFEWHRIMPRRGAPPAPQPAGLPTPMQKFAYVMGSDLAALSDQTAAPRGFKAYTFRVGIGVTGTSEIGIAKGSLGVVGQVYFARDVTAPVKRPKSFLALDTEETIPVIEAQPTPEHLEFAAANSIFTSPNNDGGVIYRLNRARLRAGLQRASRMGAFFAGRSQRADSGGWRIYELRTAFDLSISGTMPIASVSGSATSEINFFNTGF